MAAEPTPPPPPRRSLTARLLGGGARGAQRVADATGIDDAVELVTEEAIVRAVESPAFERALERVLAGPVVEEAVERALESPAVERALNRAIDSEMVDRVWDRLLRSDEAQKLVERIAEAPEVRQALAAQGVGLIADVGRQFSRIAKRLDDTIESVARRLLGRARRVEPTSDAGLISRGLAAAADAGVLSGAFFLVSAALGPVVSNIFGDAATIAVGSTITTLAAGLYLLVFWSLAGQTPGMKFLGLRLDVGGSPRIGLRRALRRLIGLGLAIIPFGIGLLPILFNERRQGWQDRIAGTEVVRDERAGIGSSWDQG